MGSSLSDDALEGARGGGRHKTVVQTLKRSQIDSTVEPVLRLTRSPQPARRGAEEKGSESPHAGIGISDELQQRGPDSVLSGRVYVVDF